jgi:hypothetical protein
MPGQSEDQTQGADQDTAARKRLPACGAKNRRGEPCRLTIVPGKRRCRFHGGLSTGPKTVEGKARVAAAQRRRWARQRGEHIRTERLRLISPIRIGPDDICALAAEDPEVRAASARLDRATPSTYRDLVAARLAAQACFEVPENKRVPLYSREVEDFLVPVMFRMGRGDAGAGLDTKVGNHTFRATGITAYLKNGGTLENAAAMANHASTRTTRSPARRNEPRRGGADFDLKRWRHYSREARSRPWKAGESCEFSQAVSR